jgi:hypothetical protein
MKFLIGVGLTLLGIVAGAVIAVIFITAYINRTIISHKDYETTIASISYQDLLLSDGLEWECGLTPPEACKFFTYASFVAETYNVSTLSVEQAKSTDMQPYGQSAEDDVRAMDVAQPTDHSKPMVTRNGVLLQGAVQ